MSYMSSDYAISRSLNTFLYGVYGWMAVALTLTAGVAYAIAQMPVWQAKIINNPIIFLGLLLTQLAIVVLLSFRTMHMSFITALAAFLVYAALVGVTLSIIFVAYTTASIFQTFLVTAAMFGIIALYGYMTKKDLSSIGSFAFMMLIGLIISQLINLYFRSQTMDYILSAVGVIVFTLLTAYDVQKLKAIGQRLINNQEAMHKVTVIGALTLYLDFINLFLYMLRFMGKRKE